VTTTSITGEKISKETIRSVRPLVPLGDICEFIRGVTFDKSDVINRAVPGYLPILRAGNIQDCLDIENDLVWVPENHVSKEQKLKIGDIAICMSSGSPKIVGKTAQLRQDWSGSVGAFCGIVRAKNIETADFISYWIRSPAFITWRDNQARGANIQNLRFSQLESLKVPLPPLPEQKRTATMLNEQMAAIDRARVAAEAQLDAAKVLRAVYLRDLYDGPEAQLWPKVALGELLSLRKEVVYPKDNPVGTATFVGLEHIESHTGLRFGCVDLDLSQLTGRKPRFKAGDIVYGYLRPYLNKVWVAEFDGLCSVDQYVYSVRQEKADTEFIAAFMRSPVYLERAPIQSTPGQLPRIRTEEVAAVIIGLPSLSEQRRIAMLLAEKLSVSDRVQKAAKSKLETINKLPSVLLRRAFNGEN
jgi:restriction endonuclease S subunit